ncbi:hypothetical protein F1559_004586 [Cyanidiococcus yangmingshanensis]|uniref:Uncharacterized protein n=1 Tax=Cyanidiococcus yangmingshanensis TaxID=2690220 RepID=A0A7J7IPL1_9RHOD|nr:hypothetical protein F1559_004586 [Cyanidiococcus yangmingshanensis]
MVFLLYNASFSHISIVSGRVGLLGARDCTCVRRRNAGFFGRPLLPSSTRITRLIMDAQYQRHFWFQERMAELGRKRKVESKSNTIQSCHADGAQVDPTGEMQATDSFCIREGPRVTRSAGGESMHMEQSGLVRGASPMNPKEDQISRSLDEEDEKSSAFEEAVTVDSVDCVSSIAPRNSSAGINATTVDADDGSSPLGSETLQMEVHEDDLPAASSLDSPKRAHPLTDMEASDTDLYVPDAVPQGSGTDLEAFSGSEVDPIVPRDSEAAPQARNTATENALEPSLELSISEQSENGAENVSAPEPATDSADTSEVPLADASDDDPTSQERPRPSAFPRVSSGTPKVTVTLADCKVSSYRRGPGRSRKAPCREADSETIASHLCRARERAS